MKKEWVSIFVVLFVAVCVAPLPAWAGLENPAPGSAKSGVSVVSGWICDAEELEVSFDSGPRIFVPYGSERSDTIPVCGDTDNGFSLLMNYNNLGEGEHTITLYNDGQVVTTRTFTVVTQGEPFIRGLAIEEDYDTAFIEFSNGIKAEVVWDEATQNLAIVDYFTLDDLLGKWEFYWSVSDQFNQGVKYTKIYEFTHTTTVDGVPALLGKDEEGNAIPGGLVLPHLGYSEPRPSFILPSQLPKNRWQFWIVDPDTDLQGNPICAFFLFDVGSADELPPAEPIQRVYGDLAITARKESVCLNSIIPDSAYLVGADRIQ